MYDTDELLNRMKDNAPSLNGVMVAVKAFQPIELRHKTSLKWSANVEVDFV